MDPTALPTDNLYKFIALSGLVLVGFLAWLVWRTQRELLTTLEEVNLRNARSTANVDLLAALQAIADRKEQGLKSREDSLKQSARAGHQPTDADWARVAQLREDYVRAEAANENRLERIAEVRREQKELEVVATALQDKAKSFRKFRLAYVLASSAALAWAGLGFVLWYYRLQAPLDAQLRLETEVIMKDLEAKKLSLARAVPTRPMGDAHEP
jgi:hypothetical protein